MNRHILQRFFLHVMVLSFFCSHSYAQVDSIPKTDTLDHSMFIYKDLKIRDTIYPFKVRETPVREKKFLRAGVEWFIAQAAPASFNYFITKDPYSHISFKNFINHQRFSAWFWDDNEFTTNQIDHPIHGYLYFNAFRSNGYNLWQSSLATFAGSYIWETGGETQQPAVNDLVNTTLGGILLGEMTHRVARNILGRSRNGRNKTGNEITAFLVNPVNGINRWLDGKFAHVEEYNTVDSSIITGAIDVGARRFDARSGDLFNKGKTSYSARLRFNYTNGQHSFNRPFDQFSVNLEMGKGDSTFINAVNVHAMLYGNEFLETKRGNYYGIMSGHYDFYNNDAFFYGAQSLNYSLLSEYYYKKSSLKLNVAGGALLLAAVPDPYLLYGDSRNYNYGSGLSYRFDGELNVQKRLILNGSYNGATFFTISGNDSHYSLNALNLEASFRFFKQFSISATGGYFFLHGSFDDPELEDFEREYPFARLAIGYSILF